MNGYFQLVIAANGTGIKIIPPTDGGAPVSLQDVREYLDKRHIAYDLKALDEAVKRADGGVSVFSTAQILPERESYRLTVSDDEMRATGYFYPPSEGQTGEYMTAAEVLNDLSMQKITYGIQKEAIESFFRNRVYCTEIDLAIGKPVRGVILSLSRQIVFFLPMLLIFPLFMGINGI